MTCSVMSVHRIPSIAAAARTDENPDAGMGLIEVVIALSILMAVFTAVGWLLTSTYAATAFAKQRGTAASVIAEVDANVQSGVPLLPKATKTCSNDGGSSAVQAWISARFGQGIKIYADQGQGSTTYSVSTTLGSTTTTGGSRMLGVQETVTWKSAQPGTTGSMTDAFQVPCN